MSGRAARVTGLGAVTALGRGTDALWHGALEGRSALVEPRALCLPDVPGIRVGEALEPTAPDVDRAYLLAEAAVREALGDRSLGPAAALLVATTKGAIGLAQHVLEGTAPPAVLHEAPLHALASRLARALDLRGPVRTISVACASGTAAVGMGLRILRGGKAEQVLVVGVDALSEFVVRGFASLRALSASVARPFDAARDGLSVGEGAAALLLEGGRGPARALVSGYGSSADANHITGPARDGAGLVRAVRAAVADAEKGLGDIDAASAHGTATRFNDAMEGAAWAALLPHGQVPVHGLKGAIGHTMGAAGTIEAVLCVRALEEGLWPPTAGLAAKDPEIPLDVTTSVRAMDLRTVVSTSSGFAGVNSAVVLCRTP